VQSAEARRGVVGLLAGVVGLDDEGGGFGRVVAGGEEGGVQDWREEGEEVGGWEAEGGFGGDSVGLGGVWLVFGGFCCCCCSCFVLCD